MKPISLKINIITTSLLASFYGNASEIKMLPVSEQVAARAISAATTSPQTKTATPDGWWEVCTRGNRFCFDQLTSPDLGTICQKVGPVAHYWTSYDNGELEHSTPSEYTGYSRLLLKGQSELFPGADYTCEIRYTNSIWHAVVKQVKPVVPDEELELGLDETPCDDATSISPMCGNPINILTGNKFQSEVDFQHTSAPLIRYERFYNSQSGELTKLSYRGAWSDNFNIYAIVSPTLVYVVLGDGKLIPFSVDQNTGRYINSEDTNSYVERVGDNYLATLSNGQQLTFNKLGQVTEKALTNGEAITFSYSNGRLISIRDKNRIGLGFNFGYDRETDNINRVSLVTPELTSPTSVATFEFTHNSISKVTYRDNSFRQYEYEQSKLSAIINENGVYSSRWTYDGDKAISSAGANDIDKTTIAYAADGSSVTVTDALGYSRVYKMTEFNGKGRIYSLSPPCTGIGCDYSERYLTFSDSGKTEAAFDAKGNPTHFTYDLANRPTTIDNGMGKTQIEWHPNLYKPTKITVGGVTQTMTYDANGNLLERVEGDGTLERSERFVRNNVGQITAHTTSQGTKSYSYDELNNLTLLTNELNQTTRFENYNEYGLPGKITRSDGQVEVIEYDLRGRKTRVSIGSLTTQYGYDAVGNLVSVKEPSGVSITYTYDDANRLLSAQSSTGVSIKYQRDVVGNVIRTQTSTNASPSIMSHLN
ncbi:DUF6531 domain-containing protein [Vibrio parahaemolyticus]|uniref:DUF6531 domain-containing protein n=1 Tax=Vibrio parahaemolyticus TaxID=670 RepID=UPI0032116A42